jgi:hypothetical protein
MMSFSVTSWWAGLCAVAVLNVLAWSFAALALYRRQAFMTSETYAVRRLQLLLSAVYVFGCAFRAAYPVYDIPRICLFDSWLSSVVIGRSIATVAELCFVIQWAVMLRQASRATGSVLGKTASLTVVPLIAIAEICSWYSVLTTSNLGHVAEESIWGLCAALLVAGMVVVSTRCTGTLRRILQAACIVGAAYVTFMFLVDVPMYWSRWIADEASGRHYLSISQGLLDISRRWVVSTRWEDWKNEVAWKTLYFTVAVWFSISLIHAPVHRVRAVADERRRLLSATA